MISRWENLSGLFLLSEVGEVQDGKVLDKVNKPDVDIKLHKRKRRKRKPKERKEHLSFSDVCELMSHDSHSRHKGAVKQKGWGK